MEPGERKCSDAESVRFSSSYVSRNVFQHSVFDNEGMHDDARTVDACRMEQHLSQKGAFTIMYITGYCSKVYAKSNQPTNH